jgi:catechol 2,3-dioxygenase-like lactoylglutathione lyase family enzyme
MIHELIQAVGSLSNKQMELIKHTFLKHNLIIQFTSVEQLKNERIITFDKSSTILLNERNFNFYNWDLIFSNLGLNDKDGEIEKKIDERIVILKSLIALKSKPMGDEVHASIRVRDLAKSAGFYSWLYGVEPKEWTHRYVTFFRADNKFNLVLLVSDGEELHQDTLYHLGIGVASKDKVIEFYHSAVENNFHIEKPPRTTWRGTPLHELWLKDPDGTLIEIYARLSEDELEKMPKDKKPVILI